MQIWWIFTASFQPLTSLEGISFSEYCTVQHPIHISWAKRQSFNLLTLWSSVWNTWKLSNRETKRVIIWKKILAKTPMEQNEVVFSVRSHAWALWTAVTYNLRMQGQQPTHLSLSIMWAALYIIELVKMIWNKQQPAFITKVTLAKRIVNVPAS